jgi:hypothetical protein
MSRFFSKLARRTGLVPDADSGVNQQPVPAVYQPMVRQHIPTFWQEDKEVNPKNTAELVVTETIDETRGNAGSGDKPTPDFSPADKGRKTDTSIASEATDSSVEIQDLPTRRPVDNRAADNSPIIRRKAVKKAATDAMTPLGVIPAGNGISPPADIVKQSTLIDSPRATGLVIKDKPEIAARTRERQNITVRNSQATAVYPLVETDTVKNFDQSEPRYSSRGRQPPAEERVISAVSVGEEADIHGSRLNSSLPQAVKNNGKVYSARPSVESAAGTRLEGQDKTIQVGTQSQTVPNGHNEPAISRPYENQVDVHIRSISLEIHQAPSKMAERPVYSPRLSRYYLRGW